MQSYISNIFMTQVMNEWAMRTIEHNSVTPRIPHSVRALMESSKHGEDGKSRNMINVHLALKKSMIEHRSSNVPHPVENKKMKFNSNFEYVPIKCPSEDPEEDDRKPAAKRIEKEPEDEAQSVTQDEPK